MMRLITTNFQYLHYSMMCSCYVEITLHPQSVNTTLNSTVSFTCEGFAELIDFQVNDSSADTSDVVNKGFTQLPAYLINGGKLRRTLFAKALKDNNNTNISCRAYGSPVNVNSDIAVLRIQGELML